MIAPFEGNPVEKMVSSLLQYGSPPTPFNLKALRSELIVEKRQG